MKDKLKECHVVTNNCENVHNLKILFETRVASLSLPSSDLSQVTTHRIEKKWAYFLFSDLVILAIRSRVSRFYYAFSYDIFFCGFVQNEKFRVKIEKFENFFQNAAKLHRSTRGTIWTIQVALRKRKSANIFLVPQSVYFKSVNPSKSWIHLSQFAGKWISV